MGFRVSKRQECKLGKLCSSPHRQGLPYFVALKIKNNNIINGGERLQMWLQRDTETEVYHYEFLMPWADRTAKWMLALGRGIRAHVVEVTVFSAIFVGMGVASQHRPVTGLILGRRQGCKATNTCFDINPFLLAPQRGKQPHYRFCGLCSKTGLDPDIFNIFNILIINI